MRFIPLMIELRNDAYFARGFHRACFLHPGDENRCIKVALRADRGETKREITYYRHLQNRGVSWEMLPRFHGEVETTLGTGAVFDLIRDADGEISRSLVDYFARPDLIEADRPAFAAAFPRLKDYLLSERIVTRTIKAKNILFQRRGSDEGLLFIIDNIGNTEFFPYANYIGCLARRKITRKWRRFESHTLTAHSGNSAIAELFAECGR